MCSYQPDGFYTTIPIAGQAVEQVQSRVTVTPNHTDLGGTGSLLHHSPDPRIVNRWQIFLSCPAPDSGMNSASLARIKRLWETWSPNWKFDSATFDRTANAFDNPDFVEVVIHSYRHRFGLAQGDPSLDMTEALLASLPPILVPTIRLHGGGDMVTPPSLSEHDQPFFPATSERRIIPSIGHNLPQEAPRAFAEAVQSLMPKDS